MLFLQLFGGASIRSPTGVMRGPVAQRRRLALLALMATSPGGRVPREKVLAYLWPEADSAGARHRLGDALHALRRSLGRDSILSSGAELQLNPAVVRSDVGDFCAALARQDREAAVALYHGPFLDGFFVPEAPEFDRWIDERRERLGRAHGQALEELAEERGAAADWRGAVRWWRRLELHDPYSSRVAVRLMEALTASGDPASALQHARTHEALLRKELGVEPDAEVVALAERLRQQHASNANIGISDTARGAGTRLHHAAPAPPSAKPGRAPQPSPVATEQATSRGSPPPSVPVSLPPMEKRRSAARSSPRFILAGLVAVTPLILWLTVTGSDRASPETTTPPARTAIAVLPFQNLSHDPSHAFFAAALHDELLTQLSKVPGITVISRSSVIGYTGSDVPLNQIEGDLDVGTVLRGSVQVVLDRLRVNVQLFDALTGSQRWAARYDRALDDVFAIQSDISTQVAAAIGATLGGSRDGFGEAPTANREAYHLYLQGREYQTRPGHVRQNLEVAQELLEAALALDPTFARARAALSEIHGRMYGFGYDRTPQRLAWQREEAEATLRLAPDLPQAHAAVGLAHYWGSQDFHQALASFATALEGLPGDAWLWEVTGLIHRRIGNWDDVTAAFAMAAQLNPRRVQLFNDLGGNTYQYTGRYREAVEMYGQALRLAPDFHLAAVQKGWTHLRWHGHVDSLRAALARVPPGAELGGLGNSTGQHLQLLHLERQADSLLHILATAGDDIFQRQLAFFPGPLYAAWAHQLRGDHEAAWAAFEAALGTLDSAVLERPDDWRVRSARGLALAGLGRSAEALAEADWLRHSSTYIEDAYFGPMVAEERVKILAQAGATDAALDELERLLTIPSAVSGHTLRLDPLWDPIRASPRFRELTRSHPQH
jgi:TolB-like protein/DNA-binding SARP family transcriptional activator/Flp pilus assembly protein TadD